MLSILVPIYNYDVTKLIGELNKQCISAGVTYEILAYEDGSDPNFCALNSSLSNTENIIYKVLDSNIGRSKIRNLLAADAKFPYLLFMDCDSAVNTSSYIKNYLKVIDEDTVVYGGRNYTEVPPENETMLRWKYGVERESANAEQRTENPYRSFMTNNFLIPKKVFRKVKLNEQLKGYGHEDTLLAIELRKLKAPMLHINNPLMHIGLESSNDFLAKTTQGVKNLAFLASHDLIDDNNKLHNYYLRFKKLKLIPIIKRYLDIKRKGFYKNLHSSNPDLKIFDLVKLDLLINELEN